MAVAAVTAITTVATVLSVVVIQRPVHRIPVTIPITGLVIFALVGLKLGEIGLFDPVKLVVSIVEIVLTLRGLVLASPHLLLLVVRLV